MALYGDAAGRPLSKIYKRVGIRRDQDLGDLSVLQKDWRTF